MRLSEEMMKYIIGVPLFVYTSSDEAMDGSMHTFTTAYVVNTHTRDIAEYYFEDDNYKYGRIFRPERASQNPLEALYEKWEEVRDTWYYEKDITLDPEIEELFGKTSNTFEFCCMVEKLRANPLIGNPQYLGSRARAKAAGIPFYQYDKSRLNGKYDNYFFVFHNEEKPCITVRIYSYNGEDIYELQDYFGAARNPQQLLAGLRQEIMEQEENPFVTKNFPIMVQVKDALLEANDIDEFCNRLKVIFEHQEPQLHYL